MPLSVIETNFTIGLDFLSSGEYNEMILLDNYNNFYGKMLFQNQFYSGLTLFYSNRDIDKKALLNYSIAYGFLGNMEIRTNLFYTWIKHYPTYSESIGLAREYVNSEIILKYRSYDYHQNNNSGWDSDDKYDILLGEIQDFGEVKLELKYIPPSYSNSPKYNLSFLSFDKLKGSDFTSLNVLLTAGLGRGFGVNLIDDEAYFKLRVMHRSYSLSIDKRLYQKFKFTFKYAQDYYNSELSDPTFKAEILALF